MPEQIFISERDEFVLEEELEQKILKFFQKNQGSAFTLKALTNRLEEIVGHENNLKYAKENLQGILNKMNNKGLINLTHHNKEDHYLIKEEIKKVGPNLEPLKLWIEDNRFDIIKGSILLGLAMGLLDQFLEFSIIITFISFIIPIIGEIIVIMNLSNNKLKYSPPIFGIAALVFDVIGLYIIGVFGINFFMSYGLWEVMYALPISIVAIICGAASLYMHDTKHAAIAIGGLYLGGNILIISLSPLLYYVLSFVAILYH